MFRKRKLFRKKFARPPGKNIFPITIILFVLLTILSVWAIDKGLKPSLMKIANQKTTEFATRAINAAVKFAEEYEFDDLIEITTNDTGTITSYGWNSSIVSKMNRVTTDRVEEFFISMNEGRQPTYEESINPPPKYGEGAEDLAKRDPTVVEIPLGQATGNTILANLGPKIPVNLELIGSVRTDVVREKEELGINGALITIYIIVEADLQVIVPFTTKVKTVTNKIYVDSRVIMGDVPEFYGGGNNGPSISVPKEDLQDN